MRYLSLALTLVSIAALVLWLGLALARFGHPYELEWMEGGMLHHVQRLLEGESIFVAPSLEFMAYPYTPLYAYLAALLAIPLGADFQTLRLISIVATLACFVLLYGIVRRASGTRQSGLVAAGVLAAAYDFTGSWFDVARVDSLSLSLVLAGVFLAQEDDGRARPTWAGVLLFLAFLGKQSAAGPAAGILVALLVRRRREAVRFGLAFTALVLATSLLFDRWSDGWYRWHVFDLLAGHPRHAPALLGFWAELAGGLGLAFAFSFWIGARHWRRPGAGRNSYFLIVALSLVLTAWVGRMHVGGYTNTLIPAAAAGALLVGVSLTRALDPATEPVVWRRALALCALLLQFMLLGYDPRPKVPTEADRQAGEQIVSTLAAVEGEVWVPSHGYLARRAGHGFGAHTMAITDLLKSADHGTAGAFVEELVGALAARRYRWIVLDDLTWEQELDALTAYYARTRVLLDPNRPDLFAPRTGENLRPLYVYEPRLDVR